jgi:hypothetical protein
MGRYLVAHRTAEATASGQAILISHLESLEAPSKILVGESVALRTYIWLTTDYLYWVNSGNYPPALSYHLRGGYRSQTVRFRVQCNQ